jgi:hypothetical protein
LFGLFLSPEHLFNNQCSCSRSAKALDLYIFERKCNLQLFGVAIHTLSPTRPQYCLTNAYFVPFHFWLISKVKWATRPHIAVNRHSVWRCFFRCIRSSVVYVFRTCVCISAGCGRSCHALLSDRVQSLVEFMTSRRCGFPRPSSCTSGLLQSTRQTGTRVSIGNPPGVCDDSHPYWYRAS